MNCHEIHILYVEFAQDFDGTIRFWKFWLFLELLHFFQKKCDFELLFKKELWVTVFELERWFTTQIEAYANTKILSIFVFWIFVSNCFYRWLKKNRMSEIPIFLQPSGPCYKKSRMKFKKQKSRSCLYFYKLQFEWWINSLAQKLWPTTLFEVGKMTKTKMFGKTRSKFSTTILLTVDQPWWNIAFTFIFIYS